MIVALALAAGLGVTGLDGRAVDPFGVPASVRALVFVFVQPDCPVSNRYVPELNRLHAEHRSGGVSMWVVYSGAERLGAVRAHHAAYRVAVPALIDSHLALADKAGATMTPEVAVYGRSADHASWALVYRGRIDDRAASVGVWRPTASVRDLADVLQHLDEGEPVAYHITQAVGCYLRP